MLQGVCPNWQLSQVWALSHDSHCCSPPASASPNCLNFLSFSFFPPSTNPLKLAVSCKNPDAWLQKTPSGLHQALSLCSVAHVTTVLTCWLVICVRTLRHLHVQQWQCVRSPAAPTAVLLKSHYQHMATLISDLHVWYDSSCIYWLSGTR